MPGIARASPLKSVSTPAMMRSSVDLPEPFRPSTPIFAPGKKDREISFRISRLGGTILPSRCMLYTYCAMWPEPHLQGDRKSTRLNSSHVKISYAVFCLKKKKKVHLKTAIFSTY